MYDCPWYPIDYKIRCPYEDAPDCITCGFFPEGVESRRRETERVGDADLEDEAFMARYCPELPDR